MDLKIIPKVCKNFISEHTPYNGLLLWHDVGVGKTCAGIGIAENFRDSVYPRQYKIMVLTPDTATKLRDEIINVEKEFIKLKKYDSKMFNVQVQDILLIVCWNIDNENENKEGSKKLVDKYVIYRLSKISRRIENFLEKKMFVHQENIRTKQKIQYIRETFSNRVIIMDEVHQTRDSGNIQDKLARPWIENDNEIC